VGGSCEDIAAEHVYGRKRNTEGGNLLTAGTGTFNPLDYPICFREARRLTDVESWQLHIPFAFTLVEMLRPEMFVELGTHKGDSYCAFCQAVDELGLKAKCFAVDTWEGDEQAGFYGSGILSELRDYHDSQYGRFSKLIQSTFDQALGYFPDGCVDLLHIDGLHRYEAVKHDFEQWLPKMTDRGVIILHDTNVREGNFGVWKLWREISSRYPHFEFSYGEGLGILAVGPHVDPPLQALIDMNEDDKQRLYAFFYNLGSRLISKRTSKTTKEENVHLKKELEEREKRILRLDDAVKTQNTAIVTLNGEISSLNGEISSLNGEISRLTENIHALRSQVARLDATVTEDKTRIAALQAELGTVYGSKSWRLTEPLRTSRKLASGAIRRIASQPRLSDFLGSESSYGLYRRIYSFIPISPVQKQRLKALLLKKTPLYIHGKTLFPKGENDLLRAAHRLQLPQLSEGKPQILVVDERLPTPDQDSGSERMVAIVRLLRNLGYRVTFIADRNERIDRYESKLKHLGVSLIYGFDDGIRHLEALGHTYPFVLLSRPEVAFAYLAPVRAYAINATVVYDTVDLAWVRFAREAEVSKDPAISELADYFKRMERFNFSCADITISITPEEKEMILAEKPDCKVVILPNIHSCVPSPKPFHVRQNLMFIGGFWHKPNEDAVLYFAERILPMIQRDIPEIIFYIVGSNMSTRIKALESRYIKPVGYVPDASPYFENSRVFVAPLRFGAGMKGKIGHSMSYGLPVVTTSIGAEGMDLREEVNVLLADTADRFAEQVVRLYRQEALWTRLSKNSIAYIQENLTEAAAKQRLVKIFGKGADPSPTHRSTDRPPTSDI